VTDASQTLAQTTDTVLGGRVILKQPAEGYRVAIDPILLAAACPAQAGETIADLGCGIGTAALCVAMRVPGAQCIGIDVQDPLIDFARENARANVLQDRVRFLCGDILDPALPIYASPVDQVVVNPPYLARGRATVSANPIKALANMEGDADLEAWVTAAARAVKPDGRVAFIHRADRLPELLAAFARRFGGIVTLPLHPKEGAPAHRVIVSGRRGQRGPATLLPGLALHQADGAFTAAAQRILRDGAPLPLIP
jgi:tRNA1(Val) A37 N6-methylase TrmN6